MIGKGNMTGRTLEQLSDLKFIIGLDEDAATPTDLVRTANFFGLYDAADFIQRRVESGETNVARLLEWEGW